MKKITAFNRPPCPGPAGRLRAQKSPRQPSGVAPRTLPKTHCGEIYAWPWRRGLQGGAQSEYFRLASPIGPHQQSRSTSKPDYTGTGLLSFAGWR
jgi:hypothetical protein